jgi:crotonobetainyl-CoA:carnitine CoA-transferase CaiB-like acyl-CoA transferase
VIERPDLLADPRFATIEARQKNRAEVEATMEAIFLERSHVEWLERLRRARLPHGELRGIAEVLSHPQIAARRLIREVESPVGPVPVIASPLRLSSSPPRYGPIPELGGDTEPILRDLGYDAAAISELRREKVI